MIECATPARVRLGDLERARLVLGVVFGALSGLAFANPSGARSCDDVGSRAPLGLCWASPASAAFWCARLARRPGARRENSSSECALARSGRGCLPSHVERACGLEERLCFVHRVYETLVDVQGDCGE